MSDRSKIEWTDATWNPIVGCSRVSAGCQNCYAERHAYRFAQQRGSVFEGTARLVNGKPTFTGRVNFNARVLDQPLRWRKPRRIFVNSMSDLFHENVPDDTIDRIFAVMALCPQHTFQVLTKRPERMGAYLTPSWRESRIVEVAYTMVRELSESGSSAFDPAFDGLSSIHAGTCLPNVWLGVSVEDQAAANERIPLLLRTPAAVRFLSCEPLLGPIDLTLDGLACEDCLNCERAIMDPTTGAYECSRCDSTGKLNELAIDWVIAGGESGPRARPMHPSWARSLRDQCVAAGVPFFFKQWGEWVSVSEAEGYGAHHQFPDGATVRRIGKQNAPHTLDGVEHHAFPEAST